MLTLSLIWWFVLGGLGLFFPFYTLYLRENAGLTGSQIGFVVAIVPVMSLVAQPFWGQVADRTGLRGHVVSVLALGTAVGYASLGWANRFEDFLVLTLCLALFYPALLPACMSASLALLADGSGKALGRVRVMGTLGFGLSVGSLPWLLRTSREWLPAPLRRLPATADAEPDLQLIFYGAASLLVLAAAASLCLPSRGSISARAERGEWRRLLRNGRFVRLVITVFLAYLSIQGPMVFFPILVRAQGGGVDAISQMWLIMLALEVPLVFYLGAGLSRVGGPRGIIAIGIVAAAVRWTVSGFVDDLRWVYLAQALHGVTVWGIILGAPIYVDAIVPERLRSTGQALLAMIGIGLGSALSNLAAGQLIESLGQKAPAQIGGIAAFALALALPWLLPPLSQAPHGEPAGTLDREDLL